MKTKVLALLISIFFIIMSCSNKQHRIQNTVNDNKTVKGKIDKTPVYNDNSTEN
jgi:hypothetical protein